MRTISSVRLRERFLVIPLGVSRAPAEGDVAAKTMLQRCSKSNATGGIWRLQVATRDQMLVSRTCLHPRHFSYTSRRSADVAEVRGRFTRKESAAGFRVGDTSANGPPKVAHEQGIYMVWHLSTKGHGTPSEDSAGP